MAVIRPYRPKTSSYEEYDPQSPAVFDKVKAEIRKVITELDIQHTGSTAVPGLGGRNKIDLLVVAERLEQYTDILTKLESVGLQNPAFDGIPDDRPLRAGCLTHQGKNYDIHVHLTYRNSEDHLKIIFFRDYLRANPLATAQYAQIKRKAVEEGFDDRLQYNTEKHPFIQSILDKLETE